MRCVRTYTHAILSYADTHAILSYALAFRLSGPLAARWAAAGALLPDLPALAGSAGLVLRRGRFSRGALYGEVCGKRRVGLPDAALHSAAVLAVALPVALGVRGRGFWLGWSGHVAADLLTHGSDARPLLWPLSRRRFASPVSYRERDRHGAAFTLLEHAALAVLTYRSLRRRVAG